MPAGNQKADQKKASAKKVSQGRHALVKREGLAKMASHPPVKTTAVT